MKGFASLRGFTDRGVHKLTRRIAAVDAAGLVVRVFPGNMGVGVWSMANKAGTRLSGRDHIFGRVCHCRVGHRRI